MSLVQDVFGTAPKSVLNKPLMHVQHRVPQGTDGGDLNGGSETLRPLTTLQSDQIPGATLVANEVTLPAGEYYIEAFQSFRSPSSNTNLTSWIKDSGGTMLLKGVVNRQNSDGGIVSLAGRLVLSASTTFSLYIWGNASNPSNGLGQSTNSEGDEVYADLLIWKLDSNIETPVISDPTLTLARPLMHVVDRKAAGVDGADCTAGPDKRDLNTVLTNEIPGASLGTNEITLPAGEYYVKGTFAVYNVDRSQAWLTDGVTRFLYSNSGYPERTTDAIIEGRITLAATTTLYVEHLVQSFAAAEKYGLAVGGTITVDHEQYASLCIWQLDAVNKQPVLVNDKLYPLPGNTYVTGNMHGLEYSYTSTSTITVDAGICMDSTNEFTLTLSTPQVVTIPSTPNTVFNLFLTDDSELVKTDTDVDGANLPAQDKRRWIGFVRTNGAGEVCHFAMAGNKIQWSKASESILLTNSTSWQLIDDSSFLPPSRVSDILYGADTAANSAHLFSYDGTNVTNVVITGGSSGDTGDSAWYSKTTNAGGSGNWVVYQSSGIYTKTSSAAGRILLHAVKLKR